MRRVLWAAARVLIFAGLLLLGAGIAPVPGEPRTYPMRPATEAEVQQHERDQLYDVLRAQQQSGQK